MTNLGPKVAELQLCFFFYTLKDILVCLHSVSLLPAGVCHEKAQSKDARPRCQQHTAPHHIREFTCGPQGNVVVDLQPAGSRHPARHSQAAPLFPTTPTALSLPIAPRYPRKRGSQSSLLASHMPEISPAPPPPPNAHWRAMNCKNTLKRQHMQQSGHTRQCQRKESIFSPGSPPLCPCQPCWWFRLQCWAQSVPQAAGKYIAAVMGMDFAFLLHLLWNMNRDFISYELLQIMLFFKYSVVSWLQRTLVN